MPKNFSTSLVLPFPPSTSLIPINIHSIRFSFLHRLGESLFSLSFCRWRPRKKLMKVVMRTPFDIASSVSSGWIIGMRWQELIQKLHWLFPHNELIIINRTCCIVWDMRKDLEAENLHFFLSPPNTLKPIWLGRDPFLCLNLLIVLISFLLSQIISLRLFKSIFRLPHFHVLNHLKICSKFRCLHLCTSFFDPHRC